MAKFYSVQQTAHILGFSTNSIYKFLDQNRLKGTRGNSRQGRFRIPHTAIENFLGTKIPESTLDAALAEFDRVNEEMQPEKPVPPPIPQIPIIQAGKSRSRRQPAPEYYEEPTTHHHTTESASGGLAPTIVRFLIILCLLFLVVDVFLSPYFLLSQQILRLCIMAILIVLAYQHGGFKDTA